LPPKPKEPKYRQPRADKGIPRKDMPTRQITRDEFESFKNTILEGIATKVVKEEVVKEVPVEKVVEKIVDRIVEKPVEKVLSGSALLNRIYFNR
jgi:hypothetical protein